MCTCRYDGQTFVKPPEVLARDRLLGTYEVKPTLERLKVTLLGAAGGLLTSAVLLLGSFAADADASKRLTQPVNLLTPSVPFDHYQADS